MIYTLTLNAAIDMTIIAPELIKNSVNRAKSSNFSPNGKGINVSLVLNHYGVKNKAIAVLGGFTGHYIFDQLNEKVKTIPIWVEEDTRLNVFINQQEGEYKVVSKGAYVSIEKQKEILNILKNEEGITILVVSGSLPPGIESSFLLDIANICKERNIEFVFDISDPILKEIIKEKPYLIKPNDDELFEIFGYKIRDESDVILALKELNRLGAKNIMLTLGDKGMYVFHKNKIYQADAVKIKLLSSACAGDSSLAAFLSLEASNVIDAIKLASATGANVAESEGIGELKKVNQYKHQVNVREVSYE